MDDSTLVELRVFNNVAVHIVAPITRLAIFQQLDLGRVTEHGE
jgi:hypothetical protein